MGWVSVKDRLPDVGQIVLVYAIGNYPGFYGESVMELTQMSDTSPFWGNKMDEPHWVSPCQYFFTDYKITHWMPLPDPPVVHTRNIGIEYADCDQFVCENCGIELQNWNRVERDEDNGDVTYHEYDLRFCPNCGARIDDE